MATTITNFLHEFLFNTLDTFNYTIVNTNPTNVVAVKMIAESTSLNNITVVIKHNGTTLATASPIAVLNELNLSVGVNCTSGDVISVVVSSSAASDTGPNQFKGFITITPNS